ncbi:unnamed protein product [Vitrella brassicaformis CCMP3155]|uniref:Potassium channel tetramerisation-type BTB domain-containing protein n=2 Tax=Vitrella brassicaformis TaxID=1169539 RepID=A0A0G4GM25_VITBC|nr:unnamed protein product [Vitrella brassicaformis CCMP3155]|eukprot:CEM31185.1 unnamed protein product [Vitrella brassicaformis CCMP3155]
MAARSTLLLNVGGTVMAFPRDALRREGLWHTCLAVLLSRFDGWMLKDPNGIHFIDAEPCYFIWLAAKLGDLTGNHTDLSDICEGSPAVAFYHDLFFATTALTVDAQHGDGDSDGFRGFMATMGPFISSSAGGTGHTVCAGGSGVATTDATLDASQTLHNRFTKYAGPVVDVSADTFRKVVEYVRCIRFAPDAATPLSASGSFDELLYACEMYGLMERVFLSMIGKSHSHVKCLFRSSHDGWEYATLLEGTRGAQSGLLFVIEDEHQHTLACHVDGPLIAPTDPTQEQSRTRTVCRGATCALLVAGCGWGWGRMMDRLATFAAAING